MHGLLTKPPLRRQQRRNQSARRHFRNGQCAAALRAITAAKLYRSGELRTLAKAAEACGSNGKYVKAAAVLLKAEDETLRNRVLAGDEPLLAAAIKAKPIADLISAYRSANNADRVAFARICGAEAILDVLVEAGC